MNERGQKSRTPGGLGFMAALLGLVAGYGLSLGVIGGLLVSVAAYLALMNLGSDTARRGEDWREDAALVLAVHLTFFGLLRFGVPGALLALTRAKRALGVVGLIWGAADFVLGSIEAAIEAEIHRRIDKYPCDEVSESHFRTRAFQLGARYVNLSFSAIDGECE